MNPAVHSSSKPTDERSTPQDLFDYANAKYGPFDLDVCATSENAKCPRYYTKETDGLACDWFGKVWCNPPYSRGEQIKWVRRARTAVDLGDVESVCLLIPADTSTTLWHDYVWDAERNTWHEGVEGEFLRGRRKFNGAKAGAKFGSALVVFQREL